MYILHTYVCAVAYVCSTTVSNEDIPLLHCDTYMYVGTNTHVQFYRQCMNHVLVVLYFGVFAHASTVMYTHTYVCVSTTVPCTLHMYIHGANSYVHTYVQGVF